MNFKKVGVATFTVLMVQIYIYFYNISNYFELFLKKQQK